LVRRRQKNPAKERSSTELRFASFPFRLCVRGETCQGSPMNALRESLAPLSALLPAHERTPLGHTNTEASRKTFCWTLSRYTVSDLVLRTRARKRNTLRISSRWEKVTWAALELPTSEFCATN
jgi:hypothetical protein